MAKSPKAPAHSSETDIDARKNKIISWVSDRANSSGDGQSSAPEFPGKAKGLFGTAGPDDPASSSEASGDAALGLVGIPDLTSDFGGGDLS